MEKLWLFNHFIQDLDIDVVNIIKHYWLEKEYCLLLMQFKVLKDKPENGIKIKRPPYLDRPYPYIDLYYIHQQFQFRYDGPFIHIDTSDVIQLLYHIQKFNLQWVFLKSYHFNK